jgi:hypothetical protein
MQLKGITFEDRNDGDGAMPETITVTMSRAELAYLTLLVGSQNGNAAEALIPGGNELNHEAYSCFSGDVINKYWNNGVSDLLRAARAARKSAKDE